MSLYEIRDEGSSHSSGMRARQGAMNDVGLISCRIKIVERVRSIDSVRPFLVKFICRRD